MNPSRRAGGPGPFADAPAPPETGVGHVLDVSSRSDTSTIMKISTTSMKISTTSVWLTGTLSLALFAVPRAQQPTAADMPQEMVWVDRSGRIGDRVGSVQNSMFYPELSPDDRFVVVSARDGEVNDRDLWIHDVATGVKRQVTAVKGNDNQPVWSPDGKKIVFTSSRSGNYHLYLKSLDPDTPEVEILGTERREFPNHWSPDGRFLSYTQEDVGSPVRDIFFLRMDGAASAPIEVLKKPNVWHDGGEFSPNSRYLAYSSTAGGAWEVYVCEVENPSRTWKVSRELSMGWAGGGGQPRWRADGRELFYVMGNDTIMSVEVETEGAFKSQQAKRLFAVPGMRGNFPDEMHWLQKYDVTRDGQRFVFVRKVSTTD
jgi:Tol biopolymer transport system component